MSKLEGIKQDYKIGFPVNIEWLISRAEELEEQNRIILAQTENNFKAIRNLNAENKRYKKALEVASSEMYYALHSNKSDNVKRFYVENAKRKVDEALKGENE